MFPPQPRKESGHTRAEASFWGLGILPSLPLLDGESLDAFVSTTAGDYSAFYLLARVEISAPHLAIAARVGGGASFFLWYLT